MSTDKERFLSRWSRLKQDQTSEAAAPAETKDGEKKKEEPMPALPPVEQLKPDSDFKPFMDPRTDKGIRREALKKLFSDAHFNVPDPFEPYSRDFTAEDPIPEEMLKTLEHARRTLLDEKKEPVKAQVESQPKEQLKDALPEAQDAAGKQDA